MKKIHCVASLMLVMLLMVAFSFSATAQVLDPARESEYLKTYGINVDELAKEEQVLPNGDVKIWYILDRGLDYMIEQGFITQREVDFCKKAYGENSIRETVELLNDVYLGGKTRDYIDGMKIRIVGIPECDYTLIVGDVDLDRTVTMKDVLAFRQFLVNGIQFEDSSKVYYQADMNYDHVFDMKDILLLRQALATA